MTEHGGGWLARLILLVSLLAVGYLSGRLHLLGSLRAHVQTSVRSASQPVGAHPIPAFFDSTASYVGLRQRLLTRLDSTRQVRGWWNQIANSDSSELVQVKADLPRQLETPYPPWSGQHFDAAPEVREWFKEDGVTVSLVRLLAPPGTFIWGR